MAEADLESMLDAGYAPPPGTPPPPGGPPGGPPDGPPPGPPPGEKAAEDGTGDAKGEGGAKKDSPRDRDGDQKRRRSRSRDRDRDRDRDRKQRRSRSRDRDRRDSHRRRRSRSRSPGYRRGSARRSRSPANRDSKSGRRDSRRSRSPPRRSRSRSKSRSRSPELTDQERDMRTVMVQQLPRGCTRGMLEEHFTKAGVVKKASLITDRNNRRSKGIAYIEFKEVASVQIALGLNGEKLNKAPLIIMMTHSEKNRQAALKEKELAAGGPSCVSVVNLPFTVTAAQLVMLFQPFADAAQTKIKDAAIHPDPQGRGSSGQGFVEFELPAAAQMAVEKMNNQVIKERQIRVSLAASGTPTNSFPNAAVNTMPNMPNRAAPGALGGPMGMQSPPNGIPGGMMPPPGMMGMGMGMGMAPNMMGMNPMGMVPPAGMMGGGLLGAPPGMAGMPGPPLAPTTQFMLNNMFDPATETDENWDADIQDEVLEECINFGPVVHIHLDKASKGNVFVKFATVENASAAQQKMNGRKFQGLTISAVWWSDPQYFARFPDAANATTPLTVAA